MNFTDDLETSLRFKYNCRAPEMIRVDAPTSLRIVLVCALVSVCAAALLVIVNL